MGKTSYCTLMQEHAASDRRLLHVANMDPAAEYGKEDERIPYNCAFDVRDLICASDVMGELEYGPNGALVYCMEYVVENVDWLIERLDELGDDDCVLPGKRLHMHVMRRHGIAADKTQLNTFILCSAREHVSYMSSPYKVYHGSSGPD